MIRDFNFFRHYRRLCIQILLENFEWRGFAVVLVPYISIGHSNRMTVAVGIVWLFGSFNVGIMTNKYLKTYTEDATRARERYQKLGLTKKQASLQWKNY